MKMKKRVLRPRELWNTGAMEAWLEDQAARGWRLCLEEGGLWTVTFTRAAPARLRVRLEPQWEENWERQREHIPAYEEMGWHYAGCLENSDETYLVYDCEDPDVPELYTDPEAQWWAWKKALRRSWRTGWLYVLVSLAGLAIMLWLPFTKQGAVENFLRYGSRNLCWSLFYLWFLLSGIRQLWAVRRQRRMLKAGVGLPDREDWRRGRRWTAAYLVIYLTAMAVMVCELVMVWNGWESVAWKDRTEPLPCVAGEVLDPALPEATADGYVNRWSSVLSPARYEISEKFPSGRYCYTEYDRLLPGLAGALYREKLEDTYDYWADARRQPIADDRFDEAVLLVRADARQRMLLRQGRRLLDVQVNVDTDLLDHLDEFAAVLADFR